MPSQGLDTDKRISLVLSIFRGENFVCKNPNGFKCQITARVGGQTLESGVILLTPTDSEPAFNSQLAWSFSVHEWKAIRSQKEAVKVDCELISDTSDRKSVLGYCVLYVKDAFLLKHNSEIDPSNAHTSLLLGLKDPWKMYSPKLKMLLHFEDSSQISQAIQVPKSPQKSVTVASPSRKQYETKGNYISTEVASRKVEANHSSLEKLNVHFENQFQFRINANSGYFELGPTSCDDDLHVINITIISGLNLHLLTLPTKNGKTVPAENFTWQIEYKAYGCDIKSDPFKLLLSEQGSKTFIGDKSSARIRANSVIFYEYLKNTSIVFTLMRYEDNMDDDKEVIGTGFVALSELADPQIRQLKYTLEMYSEVVEIPSKNSMKPEVKVLIDLESVPQFFQTWNKAEEIQLSDSVQMESAGKIFNASTDHEKNRNELSLQAKVETNTLSERIENDVSVDMFATCDSEGIQNRTDQSLVINKEVTNSNGTKVEENIDIMGDLVETMKNVELQESNTTKGKSEVGSDGKDKFPLEFPSAAGDNIKQVEVVVKHTHDISKKSPEIVKLSSDSSPSESVSTGRHNVRSMDTESYSTTSKADHGGRKCALAPPGTYQMSIKLTEVGLKMRKEVSGVFSLSFVHPPLSILEPFVCYADLNSATSNERKPNYRYFSIKDGTSVFTAIIPSFSYPLLSEPLTVDIRNLRKEFSEERTKVVGSSLIPIDNLFFQEPRTDNSRKLVGMSYVLSPTGLRIGILGYDIRMIPCEFPKSISSHYSPDTGEDVVDLQSKASKEFINPELVFKTINQLKRWEEKEETLFREKLQGKEKAYLTVLSQDYNKREAERGQIFAQKMSELKKQQKEVLRQVGSVNEREKQLQEEKLKMQALSRQMAIEQTNSHEENEMKVRRLQNEIETLQRTNGSLNAELEALRGKKLILEKSLEARDDRIRELIARGDEMPNGEILKRVNVLELENSVLKRDLQKVEKERNEFKNQAKSLNQKLVYICAEKDMQLKDENENLKLQILASKEQKELKKERREIKGLSGQIRDYKDIMLAKKSEEQQKKNVSSGSRNTSNDEEIRPQRESVFVGNTGTNTLTREALNNEISRLTKQREGLLESGCYHNYDQVVKEMEMRIIKLAQNLS